MNNSLFLKLLLLILAAFIAPASATQLNQGYDNFFFIHTVTSVNDPVGVTLEDGSVWIVSNIPFQQGDTIALIPVKQLSGYINVMMFKISAPFYCPYAFLQPTSSSVAISSLDLSTSTVSLTDGSQWNLDSSYQSYYQNWQVGDWMTIAGGYQGYYLINGNFYSGPDGVFYSYSAASPGN